jgi:phosphatidylserine/phosphatidylglycerophosphate/cardiolipin synthase-like enzyme
MVRACALALLALAGCPKPEAGPATPDVGVTLVCDRDYLPAVESLASTAVERIAITQWELFEGSATQTIEEALGDAAARGVQVRVLLDDQIGSNADAAERLRHRGVDAKVDGSDVDVHAKSWIVDGNRALVGSTNWSDSSIERNHECNLLLENGPGPAYFEAWFGAVWEQPWERVPPSVEQDAAGDVLALADDAILDSLLPKLQAASQRIDFTLYATYLQTGNMESPAMQVFSALADAVDRGVGVRGVADWSDWDASHNESNTLAVEWLEARGVEMRWEDPEQITHSKTWRVDGGLQVQSANTSSGGLRNNHEVGAWTSRASVLEAHDAWFGALWDASTEQAPQ